MAWGGVRNRSATPFNRGASLLRLLRARTVALPEARLEAARRGVDVAGERRADMARQRKRAGRRAMLQHHAPAGARLLGIGVLREIPVRIVNLQQVVKHVADEHRLLP